MITRADKAKVVEKIRADLDKARAVFLTNLIGVSSNDANAIRKEVRDHKGNVIVARNTLLARAAQGTTYEGLFTSLKGPHAVAFAFEDAPSVAKALYEKGKDLEQIVLKSGFLGDKELSSDQIVELAKLPSREEMLATLLATFNAPVSAFARVMHSIKEKKEEGGEAVAAAPAEEAKAEAPAEETETKEEKTEE